MSSFRRSALATLMGIALASASVTTPGMASAEWQDGLAKAGYGTVDVVLLRPLGFARLVIGSAILVPSTFINVLGLPLGRDTEVFKEDVDRLVMDPVWYTFQRPIGADLAGS